MPTPLGFQIFFSPSLAPLTPPSLSLPSTVAAPVPPAATSAPTRRALADSTISGLSRELPHSQTIQQTLHCCNAHPLVPALKPEALDAVPTHPMTPDVPQPLRREYHPRNAQTAVVTMPSATMIATASPESVLPPLVSCSSRPILRTAGRR